MNNLIRYLLYYLFIVLCFVSLFFLFYNSSNGDASIYFVYYKNFFNKPFSFQENTVAFGATSPLQVIVFSIIFNISGSNWLFFLKLTNFLLALSSMFLLYRVTQKEIKTIAFFSILTISCIPLLSSIFNVFEIGLVLFGISLAYYFYKNKKYLLSIFIAGFFHLIRPELIVLTIVFDYENLKLEKSLNKFLYLFFSFIPIFIYYLYMYINTGNILPTNIYNRIFLVNNYDTNWLKNFLSTLSNLYHEPHKYTVFIIGFITFFLVIYKKQFQYKFELKCFLLIISLCLLTPREVHTQRYLLSSLPFILIVTNDYIKNYFSTKKIIYFSIFINIILITFYSYNYYNNKKYINNTNSVLLKDLADKLNPISNKNDKILIYEIQSQFYLKSYCISIDGLIGSDIKDIIFRKKSYSDFIKENNVRFIVTNGDFNKKVFSKNTILEKLYNCDLNCKIGDIVTIDGIKFKKIFTNDYYNKVNSYLKIDSGKLVRNYNNEWVLWDSVFEVL
ncbi:MAG TPA: hypothetical protein VIR55_05930 [Ignavibacteria bacterium]